MLCHALPRASHSRSFHWLIAASVALALVSCSGDEPSSSKKKRTENPTELEETVNGLIEELRSSGADADELADIEALVEKASKSMEKGKPDLAISSLKKAERSLTQLQDKRAKLVEDHKKLAADKTAATDARKRAEGAKAASLAPEEFKRAQESFTRAETAAGKKSAASIVAAKQHYQAAKESFDDAAKQAKENEADKKRADEEKAVMAAKREEAKAKGAEQKAALAWSSAAQTEREAEALLAKGDFVRAKDTYTQAQVLYVECLTAVQLADDDAAREAEAKKAQELAAAANAGSNERPQEEPEVAVARPPVPAPRPGTAAPVAAAGSIGLPTGYDPLADHFLQELDEEDEQFLNENYTELLPSKKLEYDPSTAMVRMDYTDGVDVKKDAIYDPALPKREQLQFRPVMQQPQRGGGFGPDQKKQLSAYSFAANTRGELVFPVPLRFYARVEYLMQINTMDQSNGFGVYIMYDPRKKAGYMTDWVRVGTTKGTGGKGIPPKFLTSANEWFDKVNLKAMLVEYQMTGPKAGMLTNIYNNDDAANEGEDKCTVKVPLASYQRGRVGFRWDRVKFQIVDLVITGVLDKQEAVKMLREKLKKPKVTKKPAAKGEEEEPAPKDGDNPAAAPPDGDADMPKKSADAGKKPAKKEGLDF